MLALRRRLPVASGTQDRARPFSLLCATDRCPSFCAGARLFRPASAAQVCHLGLGGGQSLRPLPFSQGSPFWVPRKLTACVLATQYDLFAEVYFKNVRPRREITFSPITLTPPCRPPLLASPLATRYRRLLPPGRHGHRPAPLPLPPAEVPLVMTTTRIGRAFDMSILLQIPISECGQRGIRGWSEAPRRALEKLWSQQRPERRRGRVED
jgi:hypothetical protein